MFWADKLLKNRGGDEWVNDAWTPSGIIHMGGLKGPVIHDVLYRVIKEQNREVKFTYGFDDMDAIDGLPEDLVASHTQYMGIPICNAPSPDGNGSFGDFFGNRMRALFKALGINAEIYLASDYYRKGIYNRAITFVLDHVVKVRAVYEEMYSKKLSDDWYPLQVVCPNCGKVGTTEVTGWDGSEVDFTCSKTKVKWAQGCDFGGRISPFNGNATMPFKVEWASKWWTFGVTIEGAGKDHASAGGTYDVARKICEEVFKKEPPLRLPYEFILVGGKKMSSSKGLGINGEDLLKMIPPELVRFLMIKTYPNHAVEFTPQGTDIIPKLYDEYEKAAEAYFSKTGEDIGRAFELSQIYKMKAPPKVKFSTLAQWVQMPNMEEIIRKEGLAEWAPYARNWVENFAPEKDRFLVQQSIPEEFKKLSGKQKEYLAAIPDLLAKKLSGDELQTAIYDLAKEKGISSKDAFATIYMALLGKNHGPKAGWLIASLDPEFVKKRFSGEDGDEVRSMNYELRKTDYSSSESLSPVIPAKAGIQSGTKDIFTINPHLKEKYPSISVGIAIIKGVSIEKTNEKLEQEKVALLSSFENLTTEQLGRYPEIISYRKLYKEMGVDWHSRRPSPEALLRRVSLKKGLYTINTCVDAYNLVVMKHRISIGAFDLDTMNFPTELRLAKKGEEILLLGDSEPTQYKPTEIAYFDQRGGYNLDFNYRDAQRTAVQTTTKNLYINVDGIYDITPQKVEEVLREACDKIIEYCGGELEAFGVISTS